MLSEKELKKIARDACVDMLGKDLVYAHKELCCSCCGMTDSGLFEYNIGLDIEASEPEKSLMGAETPMKYYAFVSVDPETGEIKKDYKNSTLPS